MVDASGQADKQYVVLSVSNALGLAATLQSDKSLCFKAVLKVHYPGSRGWN